MSTPRQRQASRANGRLSKGPTTPDGKLRSAQARLKLGLTAKALVLPAENGDAVVEFAQRLFDEVQPQGEQQNIVLGRMLFTTIQANRYERVLTATITQQVANAQDQLQRQTEAQVAHFQALLPDKPIDAIEGLRRTSLGCSWLIGRWNHVREVLLTYGLLPYSDVCVMLLLSGESLPDDETFSTGDFWIRFHAVMCRPEHSRFDDVLKQVGADVHATLLARWSDPKANQAELLRRIDAALEELRAREEHLRTGPEAVARAQATEQALMIEDPKEARLWARYYAESQSIFLRSSRELRVLQDRAAEEEAGAEESAPPSAAAERSQPAPQDDLPNDPGAPVSESLVEVKQASCIPTSGIFSESKKCEVKPPVSASNPPQPDPQKKQAWWPPPDKNRAR